MGAEQSRTGAANGVPNGGTAVPHGVSTIGPNLQKRFSKGIQYNMKVVIKGDRNVGKTCLFHRLQGQPYIEEYRPTPEIQVACIQWNYKVTDDVVKVEIWDIVDKGKTKKREGLKLQENQEEAAPTLDAEFIDVYKGTSGVIMMLDITKYWTYEYIQRELPKVPEDIPIIIMASHRDMEEKRSVLSEDVKCFIQELNRPASAAAIYYMEASMKDGFGLKYLYRFFNVPFLELQRQTLLAQLRRNEEDLEAIKVELDVHSKTEEQDYDRFKELLECKRKGITPGGLCTVAAGANETAEPSSSEGTDASALEDGTTMSLRSRLSEKVLQNTPLPAKTPNIEVNEQRIDNFVPEGKLDNSFLGSSHPSREPSPKPQRAAPKNIADVEISDSEDDMPANPQVTLDQESPDEADIVAVYKTVDDGSESEDPVVMTNDDEDPQVVYNVPVSKTSSKPNSSKSETVIIDPAPSQSIDPMQTRSSHSTFEPISYEPELDKNEYEAFESDTEPPSPAISYPEVVAADITREDCAIIPHHEEELSTEISTTEVTEKISDVTSPDVPKLLSEKRGEETGTELPLQHIITPYLDLDALDQISKAPPIVIKSHSPKLSKRDRSNSPKPKKSPKKSPKVQKKKLVPPKKNLLDINLTSSDSEDQDDQQNQINPEPERTEVLATYDEPEPLSKRKPLDYSLKLTHIEPELPTSAAQPETNTPVTRQKKLPKENSKVNAELHRARSEKDELDAFFGEPTTTTASQKKTGVKKKTKKKKKKSSAVADDYEQF